MKNTLSFIALPALCALVACGGGGSTGASAALPVAPATNAPTPAPTGPPHPSAAGDTFAFGGTMTRNDSYAYPAPNPLPSTNVTDTIMQKITVTATANPYGSGTAQDFNVQESDAYPAQTLSSTSDYYYQATSSAYQLLGYSSVDDVGDKTTMTYAAPQVLDRLPETSGDAWSNTPAGTFVQTYADGTSSSATIASDGSYADTEQLYGSGTNYPSVQAVVKENADGSGLFQIVYYENGRNGYFPNEVIYSNYSVSAPVAQSSNANMVSIDYQRVLNYAGAATPAPPTAYTSFPVWYKTPVSRYSETDKNLGTQTIPSTCNAPSAFGSAATELQQAISQTDTVLGTITTTTTTSYVVNGFGPVCVIVAGSVTTYFDYSKDTTVGPVYYQGSGPMQTTTIAQTLTLDSQTRYPQSRAQARSASAPLAPVSTAAIGIARLHLASELQRERAARIKTIGKHLVQRQTLKGLK